MRATEDYIEMVWKTGNENWNVKDREQIEVGHKDLC